MRNSNNSLRLLAVCNYPSDTRPAHQVFVRAILQELVSLGVDVTVLAPEPVWNLAKASTGFRLPPRFEIRDGIPIYRPRFLTYSTVPLPFGGSTRAWSDSARARTVLREVNKLTGPFDMCFGHFLYPHGLAAAQVGTALGVPTVVSMGESSFERYENTYDVHEISQLLERFSGVIANSPQIKEHCVNRYNLSEDRVRVFPNGVNEQHFYPRERKSARQHCQLPLDRPIIIFVGQLIERKGPLRVLEAVSSQPEIGAVFLGQGSQVPTGPQVLHQGPVPHEDVPVWLSAADIFVLPTLDEGCSNAILEALFCGLPIVSSDLPFNRDVLDDQVAILVNPSQVKEIGQAISLLVNRPEHRAAMSTAALQHSRSFRLGDRAERIYAFLKTLC